MDPNLQHFFERAKRISLTPRERVLTRHALESVRIAPVGRHIKHMRNEDLFSPAKQAILQPGEKQAVKMRIEEYMKLNPAVSTDKTGFWQHLRSPFNWQAWPAMAVICALVLSGAGGVAYAAESSLPGDVLYPVKVHVNEPLWQAAAFTPERKAKVRVWQMKRRLQETEQLLAHPNLDEERRRQLTEQMQKYAAFFEENEKKKDSPDLADEYEAVQRPALQSSSVQSKSKTVKKEVKAINTDEFRQRSSERPADKLPKAVIKPVDDKAQLNQSSSVSVPTVRQPSSSREPAVSPSSSQAAEVITEPEPELPAPPVVEDEPELPLF